MAHVSIKKQTKGKITAKDMAALNRELKPWQRLAMQSWLKIDQLEKNPKTHSKNKSAGFQTTKEKQLTS